MIAVAKDHERGFFALEKFFDDDFFSCFTKGFLHQNTVTKRAMASLISRQMTTPLPPARPSALITYGGFCWARYFLADAASVKVPKDAVGMLFCCKNLFGEGFAAFQSRGRPIRSKDFQAT